VDYKDGFIYATVTSTKAGVDPHVVVKYDLAKKRVVDSLSINDKTKYHSDSFIRGSVIVGNVLILASGNQVGMCAIDISGTKMRIIDPQTEMGLPAGSAGVHQGISEVIVEKDNDGNVINEKVYFMLRQKREKVDGAWTAFNFLYEYNTKTGLATPVEAFPHGGADDYRLEYIRTRRGCLVTVGKERTGIEDWTGPSILTYHPNGKMVLFNLASGKIWEDTTLTEGDGTGRSVLCITPGPEGTNTLTMGCYDTPIITVYDITTGTTKQYTAYSQQVPKVYYDQDGKCYATGYGAASLCEVVLETGEVKVLFALNDDVVYKSALLQERVYNVTSGDGKIFATTAPEKGYLGGYLAWYDSDKQATYLAVESDKVIYFKDSDKTKCYDAKTDEPIVFTYTDGSERNYKGLITDQIPKSIVYQDGYIYGGTGIDGGSGATPAAGASAVLFAYDVANMKLSTFDLRTVIEGLPENLRTVHAVAADPDVPGKFWGQVAGTLFSFTFDKATGTFNVKEELSFSKSQCYLNVNQWTAGSMVIQDGFIFVDMRDEATLQEAGKRQIRMISKEDPTYNFLLLETSDRFLTLDKDNNIYVSTIETAGLGRYNTGSLIAEIKANKAALDAVQEKIAAIGEVTLESEEAIKAARAAYDALTDEQKALVTNLDVLTAAEAKLVELQNPKTGDNMNVILPAILMSAALLSLCVVVADKKRSSR
jgi:hypothetical protein